jgi:tRNA U34 5-methylaminomethyl-2-thiouridine-forming methyltransferase MnmC
VKNSEKILITTEDGSHTIFVPGLGEHYHSTHGAIQESMHIYIDKGLREAIKDKKHVNILEIGFGTGLNTLLTYIEGENKSVTLNYTTIEAFPIGNEMASQLNYPNILRNDRLSNVLMDLHKSQWNTWISFGNEGADNSATFNFKKINTSLLHYRADDCFDLIYFDAFAPEVQPELWTSEVFEKMYHYMNPAGILVTYCCKGTVKRNMKSAGFRIEKLPGPPGKREMLRAYKDK